MFRPWLARLAASFNRNAKDDEFEEEARASASIAPSASARWLTAEDATRPSVSSAG
jgi:hypothetical protein